MKKKKEETEINLAMDILREAQRRARRWFTVAVSSFTVAVAEFTILVMMRKEK